MPRQTVSNTLKTFLKPFKGFTLTSTKGKQENEIVHEVRTAETTDDINSEKLGQSDGEISKSHKSHRADMVLPDNPDFARATRLDFASDFLEIESRLMGQVLKILTKFPETPDSDFFSASSDTDFPDVVNAIAPSATTNLISRWSFPDVAVEKYLGQHHLTRSCHSNSAVPEFYRSRNRLSFQFHSSLVINDSGNINFDLDVEKEIKFRRSAYKIFKAISQSEHQLNTSLKTITLENEESHHAKIETEINTSFNQTLTELNQIK
jgi:hypothetical protein